MRVPGGTAIDVRALLSQVEAAPPVEAAESVAATLCEVLDARSVTFLVADFSGRAVVRLTSVGATPGSAGDRPQEQAETVRLEGSRYDRVLRSQQVDVQQLDGGVRVIAPVTDRGDAIGLLELDLPRRPTPAEVAEVAVGAHALAYVVIAARRHTDLFEWGQRTTSFSLAAEIQRRLLPSSYTCEAGQFTLAGWLEPASSVGGDTFDYVLDRSSLQLTISDAVGHEVSAALLATLLVGALRNARRRGMSLAEQARYANEALLDNAPVGQFVTGQLVRVDLATGRAVVVNAGHPFPLRLRDGEVSEVELLIEPPFGVDPGRSFTVCEFPLEPGDRLVFLTDGMQERNAASFDVARTLAATAALHPREVVHELGAAVLRATGGDLRDDATMVCLDWYGGPPRRRDSDNGSGRELASPVPGPSTPRRPAR
jgi:serine phosphatase RsbU (regulator of sigma subunit)